jgi:hypothetical protein
MKTSINKILSVALVLTIMLAACQPEDFNEIGDKRDIPVSLGGTWKLSKVTQKDEDAARKGFPYSELDLTTVFPYTDFTLTLNTNGVSPSNFTANAGNSPEIIGLDAGTWSVDNGENPTAILFKSGSITEQVTLGAYPVGGNTKLKFKIDKKDAGSDKLLISYTYEFTKQ